MLIPILTIFIVSDLLFPEMLNYAFLLSDSQAIHVVEIISSELYDIGRLFDEDSGVGSVLLLAALVRSS